MEILYYEQGCISLINQERYLGSLKKKDNIEKDSTINKKSKLRENIEMIVVAVLLALFIRAFIVQAFKIPSGSMLETLQIGDHILVNKFIYGVKLPFIQKTIIPISDPERDDIVVFKFPKDPSIDYIKRVVGVAGDKIEIINKKVYVNNELVDPDYAIHLDYGVRPMRDNFGPIVVPEKSLFVMGDNRDSSNDSRFWGFVDLKAVKGKAFIIYWSWNRDEFNVRWNRLGSLLK